MSLGRADRIAIDAAGADVGSPTPLDGIVEPDHHRRAGRHEGLDQQEQQAHQLVDCQHSHFLLHRFPTAAIAAFCGGRCPRGGGCIACDGNGEDEGFSACSQAADGRCEKAERGTRLVREGWRKRVLTLTERQKSPLIEKDFAARESMGQCRSFVGAVEHNYSAGETNTMKPFQDNVNVVRTLFLDPTAPCQHEAWQVVSANVFLTIAITACGCIYVFTNGGDVNYIFLGFLVFWCVKISDRSRRNSPSSRTCTTKTGSKTIAQRMIGSGDDSTILTAAAKKIVTSSWPRSPEFPYL